MEQTAVEWFVEQLKERGYAGEFPPHLLFEQAKEMEKQQGYSEEDMLKSFMAGIKFEEDTLEIFMTGIKCESNNEQTFKQNFKQFIKQIRL